MISGAAVQELLVSQHGRGLIRKDGTPFFWLGDTAWNLFHKLSREEADYYLKIRKDQQFNVVQAVLLTESDGVRTGNRYGRKPLKPGEDGVYDPAVPDEEDGYSYWDHVDYIVRRAASLGIYMALLPTWGDKFNCVSGKGPEIFTEENAYVYGRWLGRRYRNDSNILWVLGGDRALHTRRHFAIIDNMARGLKEGSEGRKLLTFHPKGSISSSHYLHEEPWLDFNMVQSGHGDLDRDNYRLITEDYARRPVKPVLDAEPCYEDFPRGFRSENGYFDAADVRRAAYYAVFAGAFGHTYGHQSVWIMSDGMYDSFEQSRPGAFIIMDWKTALTRPGANQMRHIRSLMESLDVTQDRVPDQELISDNFPGANYMTATRGSSYAMIYLPNGLYVRVVMGRIAGERVRASWFSPLKGDWIGGDVYDNRGVVKFTAPSSGRGCDWVLCLNSVDKE